MGKQYKIGDVVWVKYDVEQRGTIEDIKNGEFGRKRYHVRVFDGGYVSDRTNGVVVEFCEKDFF